MYLLSQSVSEPQTNKTIQLKGFLNLKRLQGSIWSHLVVMKDIQNPADLEALSATNKPILNPPNYFRYYFSLFLPKCYKVFFRSTFRRLICLQFSHLLFSFPAFGNRVVNAPLKDNDRIPLVNISKSGVKNLFVNLFQISIGRPSSTGVLPGLMLSISADSYYTVIYSFQCIGYV